MKLTPQEAKDKTKEQIDKIQDCDALREKPRRETLQMSLSSGNPYKGNNQLWLKAVKEYKGYAQNTRAPFLLIQKKGGRVLSGEKATWVIHWERKVIIRESTNPSTGETKKTPITRWNPFVHQIFNLDQTTLALPKEEIPVWKIQGIETAEDIIKAYADCPPKFRNSDKAYYSPKKKEIHLPPRELFKSLEDAYHTEFHEEGHSSGDEEKLNRPGITGKIIYGSPEYAHEELVAEISALIRSTLCGLDLIISEQSLAYLKGWNKESKNTLSKPFNEAQTAADYMLGLYKPSLQPQIEGTESTKEMV